MAKDEEEQLTVEERQLRYVFQKARDEIDKLEWRIAGLSDDSQPVSEPQLGGYPNGFRKRSREERELAFRERISDKLTKAAEAMELRIAKSSSETREKCRTMFTNTFYDPRNEQMNSPAFQEFIHNFEGVYIPPAKNKNPEYDINQWQKKAYERRFTPSAAIGFDDISSSGEVPTIRERQRNSQLLHLLKGTEPPPPPIQSPFKQFGPNKRAITRRNGLTPDI